MAAASPREAVEVLVEDLVEANSADFARGDARGVQVAADGQGALLRGWRGGAFISGPLSISFAATHLGLHWILRD